MEQDRTVVDIVRQQAQEEPPFGFKDWLLVAGTLVILGAVVFLAVTAEVL